MKTSKSALCATECAHEDVVLKAKAGMPSEDILYEISELFKVFGDSTRTNILSALLVSEMCVCDIAKLFNMTVSAVSHQLRVLRHNKLVKFRKQGKTVIYSLNDDHIEKILRTAIEHITE